MRSYEATFEWLKAAMLVNVAYNAREPNVGLELSADHSALKCFLGAFWFGEAAYHQPACSL